MLNSIPSLMLLLGAFLLNSCLPTVSYIEQMNAYPEQIADSGWVTFEWKYGQYKLGDNLSAGQTDVKVTVRVAASPTNLVNGEFLASYTTSSIFQNKIRLHMEGVLVPGQKYYWNIQIKGSDINYTTRVASFYTQKQYPDDWHAEWISYPEDKTKSLPLLRREFELSKGNVPDMATIFICAPGFYLLKINGNVVGNEYLSPPQTNFEYYALYQVFEVGRRYFKPGMNTIDVYLGEGWYAQDSVWNKGQKYGSPCLLFDMQLQTGKTQTHIGSDTNWKWTEGPYLQANIFAGVLYDARREDKIKTGEVWWLPSIPANEYPPKVYAQAMEPIRIMNDLPGKTVKQIDDSTYVVDFGQNFTGWVKMQINEPSGKKVSLKLAEEINADGYVNTESTGVFATKVEQIDSYISAGKGKVTWSPRFTYHGFRYAEVTGLSAAPSTDDFTGQVLHTDMPLSGGFYCSNEQINQLHELNIWTLKSNLLGVPLDCPHREKCGWTGDAHTIAPAVLFNFDAGLFFNKYLHDVHSAAQVTKREIHFLSHFKDRTIDLKPAGIPFMSAPGKRRNGVASPEWGSVVVQLPWYLFRFTSDTGYLHQNLDAMLTWVDYIHSKSVDDIVEIGLGDWCPPGGNAAMQCPIPLSSTAFHYLDLSILLEVAHVLNQSDLIEIYQAQAEAVKKAFNTRFYLNDSVAFGSQTANVLALKFGLANQNQRQQTASALVNDIRKQGFITTGIFGLKNIFQVLCDNGYEQVAFDLLTKKGYNSFAYMWDHYGATTMWEVLPIDDYYDNPAKNDHKRSHNHPMNASFDAFFFTHIAGIEPPVHPYSNQNIIFKPYFTRYISEARASYKNRFGSVFSYWQSSAVGLKWIIQLPQGSKAKVYIPVNEGSTPIIRQNNNEIIFDLTSDMTGNWVVLDQVSGNQKIEVVY